MKILAIETSCDETAISILETKGNIKHSVFNISSNIVASQVKIHAAWGGVVPNLAKREHQRNLPIILRKALRESKLLKISNSQFSISKKIPNIDLIAVTNGPGLEPCLWVGINFAQDLAKKWRKPLLGINHLEGHIFSVFLKENRESTKYEVRNPRQKQKNSSFEFRISDFEFPAIALLVSGGHTELVLIKEWLKYKVIGQTLDDAAGEAFDKVARLLKLGYPGGPVIAAEAAKFPTAIGSRTSNSIVGSPTSLKLPRPMINSKDYNFSFSGLKTAVLYKLREFEQQKKAMPSNYDREYLVSAMAKEFQQAAIDVLIKKTIRAAKEYEVKTIILGGGVAANKELRQQLAENLKNNGDRRNKSGFCFNIFKFNAPDLLMPKMEFTGDNAAMIALAAYFRVLKLPAKKSGVNKKIGDGQEIVADSNLNL